jgi:NitT/TauT family transport system ATP-binding protein
MTLAIDLQVLTRPETHVAVCRLDKTYASPRGDLPALVDINLEIAAGEFVSIVGPSGCGKSTLLKCVAGLEEPSSGEIRVGGSPLRGPPDKLGVVFQRDVLLDWRTILDNVLLSIEFLGLPRAQYRPRAQQLLDRFGLGGFEDRHPWELSGGMRQRASICRALLADPELLLMDEPFGALDAMTRDDLNLELTRIWQDTRKTVLFVTHSIAEAVYLSDRVVMMSRAPGRIIDVIDIDLPRPRPLSMRETPAFGAYVQRIRHHFAQLGIVKE